MPSYNLHKRLPANCIQCGKAELSTCPYHMGERRDPHLSLKLVRGVRKFLPVDGALPDGHSLAPNVIVLVPTLRCNLSCIYCFQRNGGGPQSPMLENYLSLAEWRSAVNEVRSLGLPVIVMGGGIISPF